MVLPALIWMIAVASRQGPPAPVRLDPRLPPTSPILHSASRILFLKISITTSTPFFKDVDWLPTFLWSGSHSHPWPSPASSSNLPWATPSHLTWPPHPDTWSLWMILCSGAGLALSSLCVYVQAVLSSWNALSLLQVYISSEARLIPFSSRCFPSWRPPFSPLFLVMKSIHPFIIAHFIVFPMLESLLSVSPVGFWDCQLYLTHLYNSHSTQLSGGWLTWEWNVSSITKMSIAWYYWGVTEVKPDLKKKKKKRKRSSFAWREVSSPIIDCVSILSVLQQIYTLPGNLCNFSTSAKPYSQGRLVRGFH